jgi:organic hydroperoxide reductase OsmC/OhrA
MPARGPFQEHFRARSVWTRGDAPFTYEGYGRDHEVALGSGMRVTASAAPAFRGSADKPNPEELLVAALSSCHMLTFLAIASKKGLTVERYEDEADGLLERGPDRKLWVTKVELCPRVTWGGEKRPTPEELEALHAQAHAECFIASSVRTEITVRPREG